MQQHYPTTEIVTLDILLKWNLVLCCDIVSWTQIGEDAGTMYNYGLEYFDFIWASPPCTEYSRAKTVGVRDLTGADERVRCTLRAIEYLRPKYFVLENPDGLLQHRPLMQEKLLGYEIPTLLNKVTYCKYGTPYMKPTHLWTNIPLSGPLEQCNNANPCPSNETYGYHLVSAQSGPTRKGVPGSGKVDNVYPIPKKLMSRLLQEMDHAQLKNKNFDKISWDNIYQCRSILYNIA